MTEPARIELERFARNVHSQFGEDGILEKLFEVVGTREGFFVELGAADGIELSNTRSLLQQGWGGILIEGDPEKFRQLQRNVREERVTLLEVTVEVSGPNSLERVLDRARAPERIDLLSIDIDSDDLALWMSLGRRRPICVVIEYNPTIPFDVPALNPPGKCWGNSALSIQRHAVAAGYRLVAVTEVNLVLVQNACAPEVATVELDDRRAGSRYFWGYDGTLVCRHSSGVLIDAEVQIVPWHDYRMVQPMPAFLRRWRQGRPWKWIEVAASVMALAIVRPLTFFRYARSALSRRWRGRVSP